MPPCWEKALFTGLMVLIHLQGVNETFDCRGGSGAAAYTISPEGWNITARILRVCCTILLLVR